MKIKDAIKKYNIKKITILYDCDYRNGVEAVDLNINYLTDKDLNIEVEKYYKDEYNRDCVII